MFHSLKLMTGLATFALLSPLFASKAPWDSYAIVATKAVAEDKAWRAETIDRLMKKYPHAKLFVWEKSLNEVQGELKAMQPAFTAYVAKPEEANIGFVMSVNVFSRLFDDDPYVDTFWGIITGYDAASAGLLAGAAPITIERALDCSGTDLKAFNEAWRYTEDHRGTMNYWKRGAMDDLQKIPCNTDNTQGMLERLQKDKVQFLSTSGHATEHDWQMGYCGPNMEMRHKDGALIAVDTEKKRWPAHNDEPKVYLANGNCLIGNIDQTDCMALSWMRDGGVRQMMGYTVTTWFGAQGWGTLGLFVNHAGMTTANEAFHFTNTSIVKTIQGFNMPDMMTWHWTKVEKFNFPQTKNMLEWAQEEFVRDPSEENQKVIREKMQKMAGNLHDRDSVAFYGDPALKTTIDNPRIVVHPPKRDNAKKEGKKDLVLSFTAKEGVYETVPVWLRLPGSWTYADVEADAPLGMPTLAIDNMLHFAEAKLEAGKTYTVRLKQAKRKTTRKFKKNKAKEA